MEMEQIEKLRADCKGGITELLHYISNIADIIMLDYADGVEKAPKHWELYTLQSVILAQALASLYQIDEPEIGEKLQEITDILAERMY